MAKLNSITSRLNLEKSNLINKIKSMAPKVLKDYSASVEAQNAAINCEPGYEYQVLPGNGDTSQRTKCLKCPRGTYYKGESEKCTVCDTGLYQDEEGKLSCKQCPAGTTTVGNFAQDFHECKEICSPGTYSTNGLANCLACPIGTFQPLSRSTSCIKCKSGKATHNVGSVLESDCEEPGLRYEVRSEGCEDSGITGCGIAKIVVNGKNYSPQRRGINLVAINAKTGLGIQTVFHDWHGDTGGCQKTFDWVTRLPNDYIVLAAYQDEAAARYDNNFCRRALLMIGGKEPFQREFRGSFTLIGYKGVRHVDWIKQKQSPRKLGPTVISGDIKLLK